MNKFAAVALIVVAVGLSGCGRFDRWKAGTFGGAAETCVDGVMYLQFTSGATPKYTTDGDVVTCK